MRGSLRNTHMQPLFYRWMLMVVLKFVQDLVGNVQKAAAGYQVDAGTDLVVWAPAPSFKHLWLNFMDNPESEALFVCSWSSTEVSCLIEVFFNSSWWHVFLRTLTLLFLHLSWLWNQTAVRKCRC